VKFAIWVYNSKVPYKVVEERSFIELMRVGRPDFYIPSASTVFEDVKDMFDFGSEDFGTLSPDSESEDL
jgi:hypothetical protein